MISGSVFTAAGMKDDAARLLRENILPFWAVKMPDAARGGFYGRIDGNGNIITDAPKGAILNARILWTFSAAFLHSRDSLHLMTADRAWEYIRTHFFDELYGGTYWCLTCEGAPSDTKKQIYSLAFFIYALSCYYKASGDREALDRAVELFGLIEEHSFDKKHNGYLEAFDRQWGELADLRLSAKDANEKKTMNTHLHILEAYTALYRVWPDQGLKEKLANLIGIFTDRIIDGKSGHLNLFFDEEWNSRSLLVSYGHDIEASWLIYEAAMAAGCADKVRGACVRVAEAACEGLAGDGSMFYEKDDAAGHFDRDRHWWVQAEAVVGFLNVSELTGDSWWTELSIRAYEYIVSHLVDFEKGEWFWSIRADGTVNTEDDRAGFWKCPYHNSRMCLEIIARL